MRVTKVALSRTCAICERSLLMGERTTRFAPDGDEFVEVCPLCQETAMEHGWVKEGSPTSLTVPYERRRRGLSLGAIFQRPTQPEPIAPEPILRRLSESELQTVEAADLFNASAYRRTIGGIAKSRRSRSNWLSAGTKSRSSTARTRAGTRASNRTAASSRRSLGSSVRRAPP
jgi:hypothetical protein